MQWYYWCIALLFVCVAFPWCLIWCIEGLKKSKSRSKIRRDSESEVADLPDYDSQIHGEISPRVHSHHYRGAPSPSPLPRRHKFDPPKKKQPYFSSYHKSPAPYQKRDAAS
eukprot:UN23161